MSLANSLSTKTAKSQKEMGVALGRLARQFLLLRAAKKGSPDLAKRSAVKREMDRIVGVHSCTCSGIDDRLRSIWKSVSFSDYAEAIRLADQWERQS